MSIIQQPTLFDIDYLSKLDIKERHAEIFSPIDFTPLLRLFDKESSVGAPIKVDYESAIRAIMTRFLEGIPTMKALVKRLKEDVAFKLSLGFLYSQPVPSEATFSRIFQTLKKHNYLLEELNCKILVEADEEFGIFDEEIAIDATAIDGHSKPHKTKNKTSLTCAKQLDSSTETIMEDLTIYPSWGKKKNSQGKNSIWFGYKSHLAVCARSEFILAGIMTSAYTSDMTVAIPLIRRLSELGINGNRILLDKGYDAKAIYTEAHRRSFEPFIPLKKVAKNDGEADEHCRPTCLLEHSYLFDSYDKRYGALKFVRPEKRCRECPLANEGLCQKVIKIKQSNDYRKYNNPARGTRVWELLYNKRSSVERVNAYLKENYQFNDTNYFKAEHVQLEQQFIQLAYNAKKLANYRLAKRFAAKETVA